MNMGNIILIELLLGGCAALLLIGFFAGCLVFSKLFDMGMEKRISERLSSADKAEYRRILKLILGERNV